MNTGSSLDHCGAKYRRQMYRLRSYHWNGGRAGDVARLRTSLIDSLVRDAVEASPPAGPQPAEQTTGQSGGVVWLAVGEYGRQQLAPFSPVEILVIGRTGKWAPWGPLRERVETCLHSAGIEFQLRMVPLKECLQLAQAGIDFCLSLLVARVIWGDEALFGELQQRIRSSVSKNPLVFTYDLERFLAALHQRHGASVYLLESDIEADAGGIIDSQILCTALKLHYGQQGVERLLANGQLSPWDWQKFLRAQSHLLKVRNHLHFLMARRCNLMSAECLSALAGYFGYPKSPTLSAAEAFLRDTLKRRRHIHSLLTDHLEQEKTRLEEGSGDARGLYLKLAMASASPEAEETPERFMKLLQFNQTQPLAISESRKRSIRSRLSQWTFQDLSKSGVHEGFRALLKSKGKVAPALRTMRELGVLGKYLPEFQRLDCLPRLDSLHPCSLDELTLHAVEVVDEVATSRDPSMQDYQRVLEQVSDPSLLYLALLFIHTGQSGGSGEAVQKERLAARALQRMNVEPESREKLLLLVREHQLLGHVSQRRDIDDPLIVQEVSENVETSDNLNMLLLLTHADWRARGRQEWSERKDFLLWSLYFKVFDRLMFGDDVSEPEHARVAVIQQQVLEALENELETEAILRHFLLLPEKYALYTPQNQILVHIRLCERLQGSPVVTQWVPYPHVGYTELYLSTRDMPGRFAQIAGCLAGNGISILSAQLNTRKDDIVIDTFQVSDMEGKAIVDKDTLSEVDRVLAGVIQGEIPVEELLESRIASLLQHSVGHGTVPRIRIDNDISSHSTVIEVQAQDRLGLGYQVARTLADLGLNILSAKLSTEKNHSLDVFYTQTREGEKITGSFQMTEIVERLRRQLSPERT